MLRPYNEPVGISTSANSGRPQERNVTLVVQETSIPDVSTGVDIIKWIRNGSITSILIIAIAILGEEVGPDIVLGVSSTNYKIVK